MCPYVFSSKFSVLAPRCSCSLGHNLQPTSDHFDYSICKLFGYQNDPCDCLLSSHLYLQGTCRSFKCFPMNALLSFCRNMKSAVHVPYAGWLILSCSALACTHDLKNNICHQSTCFAATPSPCCDEIQQIVACMSSPLWHHLYTMVHIVAWNSGWKCWFVSKHL